MPRPAVTIPLFFADLIGGRLGIYPGPRDFDGGRTRRKFGWP
jgi:hypothetical protein